MKWISLRNRWPENPGRYWVKDCREDVEGWSNYDGYDWEEPEFVLKARGSLILRTYTVTHWVDNEPRIH